MNDRLEGIDFNLQTGTVCSAEISIPEGVTDGGVLSYYFYVISKIN